MFVFLFFVSNIVYCTCGDKYIFKKKKKKKKKSGKFHLRLIDETDTPNNVGLCVKHGAANGTIGCWIINGNHAKLTDKERQNLCAGKKDHDCTLYVQPTGKEIGFIPSVLLILLSAAQCPLMC